MKVITAAIIAREGRFLLAQRKDGDDDGGLWEFPGGRVEQGETPDGCVVRELWEELGVTVRPVALYDALATGRGDLLLFYLCITGDEPRPIDCQALRWAPPGELADLATHESDRQLMARLAADAPQVIRFLREEGGECTWDE